MNASRIILALVFVALIAFVAAEEHCIEKAFKARAILADPKKSFDDTQYFYYDASTNKQRTDIKILEPVQREVSLYYRYDLGKAYEYDRTSGTCQSFPLTGSLNQFCLAQDAKHSHDIVIGGSLKCQVWDENIQGLKLRLVIAPSGSLGVPVNIISRGGATHSHVFQEWYDFQGFSTLPDQSVFNLPSACQNLSEKRSLERQQPLTVNPLQFMVAQN